MALLQTFNSTGVVTAVNDSNITTTITPPLAIPLEHKYKAHEYIILIGTPFIVILGTIFNAISIAVLSQPRFRKMSTSVYLITLAITDTISLYANSMTKNFIKIICAVDYSTLFSSSCSIYLYVLFTSRCFGAWLIVSVTLERILVTYIPIKAKIISTQKRATLVTLCIMMITMLSYLYTFVVWEVHSNQTGRKQCKTKLYYVKNGFDFARKMVDMFIYSILPSVTLFTTNAALIYKVVQSSRFRAAATTLDETARRKSDTTQCLTIMLMSVSIAFLILTLPLPIFYVHIILHSIDKDDAVYNIIYRSLYLVQLTNSAINFLLYCASGPAFRKELFNMLGCSCTKPAASSMPHQTGSLRGASCTNETSHI